MQNFYAKEISLYEAVKFKDSKAYLISDNGKLKFRVTLKYSTTNSDIYIGDESILISNIDSPNCDNTIKCKCGKYAYLASSPRKTSNDIEYYYCPDCNNLYSI